jgi:opacity protein-like surface antigen
VIRKVAFVAAAVALVGSAAWAQEKRVELSGNVGYTLSDGVSGSATNIDGEDFTRIDPKDSVNYGGRLGFMVTPNIEVGGLFSLQSTTLQIGGVVTADIGDEKIYNYHGYVAYNFGEGDAKVRPYILGGLGATQFGGVNIRIGDRQDSVGGNTKFSTTWALGVKMFPAPNVGIRLEARWTPTYIKSDAAGWWCDPYWGYCYVVGDAQYANQFDFGGGIVLRF